MADAGHEPAGLTLLERREVEARIVGPILRAFEAEMGRERVVAILRPVIAGLAKESGAELARELGETTLGAFAGCLGRWNAGGALEMEVLRQDESALDFNVTRCRYAEMYRALGLEDLGGTLSCHRDFAVVEGFSSEIKLERTQTLMEGASHCDFRFRREVR